MKNWIRDVWQNIKQGLSPRWRTKWYRLKSLRWRKLIANRVGKSSYVDETVHVLRWRNVKIGHSSCVCSHTVININDYSSESVMVSVGNFCWIGRRNFLNPGASISLGDYTMTGPDCRFLGADHVFDNPFVPYIASGMKVTSEIRLGANCWLGAEVTILGNVTIGHGSIIGAGAMVKEDIPPFSIAVGNPARVVKRYDCAANVWTDAAVFSAAQEALLPDEHSYLSRLQENHPNIAMPWRAAGKSMGDTY